MYFLNNSTYYYSELTNIHSSYLIIINVFSSHNGSFYLILSTCVNITLFISNYIANGSYVTVADSLFYCNYVRLIVHVVLPLLSLAPPSS